MRKFTKGLLLTLVASAMSIGAYAQDDQGDGSINAYYRVINAGYKTLRGTGVMYISEPTTAQPQKNSNEAVTLPGTVMYINAEPMSNYPQESLDKYMDIKPTDLIVHNLRSQGVDAEAAIYGPLREKLRVGFTIGLNELNKKWGLPADKIQSILDEMFYYMQMFMEETDIEGEKGYYLKSTTPNTQPLIDALEEAGIAVDFEGKAPKEWAKDKMFGACIEYYTIQGDQQLADEFLWYEERIHIGHTYYVIGGRVDTDLHTYQVFNPGKLKGEFISFANNNQYDYESSDILIPEIERANEGIDGAKNFAKWFIEEIKPGTETDGLDYFAVQGGVLGRDNHYYTTIYTDYPMEIVDNDDNTVRVWSITDAPAILDGIEFTGGGTVAGYVKATEIIDNFTDEEGNVRSIVPARIPVVVECQKSAREGNLLNPVLNPLESAKENEAPHGESFLKGIFFSEDFNQNAPTAQPNDEFKFYKMPLDKEYTSIARRLIRVFNRGNDTENPLGFFKYSGSTMYPNKAFMILDSGMANANIYLVDEETFDALGINEVATTTTENATIYDIQGRMVKNPTKGLYIVNGKKMVIK